VLSAAHASALRKRRSEVCIEIGSEVNVALELSN
jgi:hypothetical protein